MKLHFALATDPPKVSLVPALAGYAYAALLSAIIVAQLFFYEDFSLVFGDSGSAFAMSLGIIFLEILALPYLLRLRLSALFRSLSFLLGYLMPVLWLFMTHEGYGLIGGVSFATSVQVAILGLLLVLAVLMSLYPSKKSKR